MEIIASISELKQLGQSLGNQLLQAKISELEIQVLALLEEKQESAERCHHLESEFSTRLLKIRHDAAQPLTTVQFFLDLLPTVLQQEQLVPEKYVNRNFWTHTYSRAQEAVKSIPKILQRQ